MKRLMSAALASALMLGAGASAFAAGSGFSGGARTQKISTEHVKHVSKAAAKPSHFASVPGKHHFGPAIMTKAQLAKSHGFASTNIPTLTKKP